MPAYEAQVVFLRLAHDCHLGARDVGDEGVGRRELGDELGDLRDRGCQHVEVGAAHLLEGRGPVDGARRSGLFQNLRSVHACDVPPGGAGCEADGAPDQAHPHYPQRTAHERDPITRSFSPESPMVTRLQPGYPSASPSRTSTPALSKTSGHVSTSTKLPCEGTKFSFAVRNAFCTRSRSPTMNSALPRILSRARIEAAAAT